MPARTPAMELLEASWTPAMLFAARWWTRPSSQPFVARPDRIRFRGLLRPPQLLPHELRGLVKHPAREGVAPSALSNNGRTCVRPYGVLLQRPSGRGVISCCSVDHDETLLPRQDFVGAYASRCDRKIAQHKGAEGAHCFSRGPFGAGAVLRPRFENLSRLWRSLVMAELAFGPTGSCWSAHPEKRSFPAATLTMMRRCFRGKIS